MISLYLDKVQSNDFVLNSGFDGIYTYFASVGFTMASNYNNWNELNNWCLDHKLLFIPSVGPGYIDTRIRPWNNQNTKSREGGKYYKKIFEAAIAVTSPIISITSWNEWGEGTQIEPCTPKKIAGFSYEDYQPFGPDYYLQLSKDFSEKYQKHLMSMKIL